MSRLIESIRLLNGVFSRLPLHQERIDRAFKEVFGKASGWKVAEVLRHEPCPQRGLYKCRFVYDETTTSVEFVPYTAQPVSTLKVVRDNEVEYGHKFEDRAVLNRLLQRRGTCDDILIVRDGQVTDSSYANVVFRAGNEWITPATCLLPGTMRHELVASGIIKVDEVRESAIKHFDGFKLINAMLEWSSPEYHISNIH